MMRFMWTYLVNQLRGFYKYLFERRLQKSYWDITKLSEEAGTRYFQSSSEKNSICRWPPLKAAPAKNSMESCLGQKGKQERIVRKTWTHCFPELCNTLGAKGYFLGIPPMDSCIKFIPLQGLYPAYLQHLPIKQLWASFINERNFALGPATSGRNMPIPNRETPRSTVPARE